MDKKLKFLESQDQNILSTNMIEKFGRWKYKHYFIIYLLLLPTGIVRTFFPFGINGLRLSIDSPFVTNTVGYDTVRFTLPLTHVL